MKYDLLLTGGDVLDPAGGLRGLMDIGIAGGKISAVAPSLPAADARRTISAKGRLVTPGLVDIHAHIFVNASDMAATPTISVGRAASPRCAMPAAPARRPFPGCVKSSTARCAPGPAPS